MKNFKEIKHIHFSGIGGVSMSALAKFMKNLGKKVSGSDNNLSNTTTELQKSGITITENQNLDSVKNCDLLVYTSALLPTHPELVLAKELNKPIIERAEFLGILAKSFERCIAVSGTHGKTTTTSMIAYIMQDLNPTVHIGGFSAQFKDNLKMGNHNLFITEVCEFNKSLLYIQPTFSVVTNLEPEHMNCYKNQEDLVQTFEKFMTQTSDFVVLNNNLLDTHNYNIPRSKIIAFDVGKKSDFWAGNEQQKDAYFSFDCYKDNFHFGRIQLQVPGKHNVYNAMASIALTSTLGIPFEKIKEKLESWTGVQRRFQTLHSNPLIISDYAHHPTEIEYAIQAANLMKKGKLFCVFEPHTYSRTLTLFDRFLECFTGVDELFLLPTYSAREKEIKGGTALDLFRNLPPDINTTYFDNANLCEEYLFKKAQKEDLILWMGAGTVEKFAIEFVAKLKNKIA